MGLEQVFQNDNVVMSIDKENDYLLNKWTGFPKTENYKEALEKTIDILQEYNITNIVADMTEFKTPMPEALEWFQVDWLPRAIKVGLKKMAVMMPTNVIAKMTVTRVVDSISGFETDYFDTLEKCVAWFKGFSD